MKIPWGVLAGMGLLAGGMRNPDSFNQSAGILSGAADRRRRERALALQQRQEMERQEQERQDNLNWRNQQAQRWGEDRTAREQGTRLRGLIPLITQYGQFTPEMEAYVSGFGPFPNMEGLTPREGSRASGVVNQNENRSANTDIRRGGLLVNAGKNMFELTGDASYLPMLPRGLSLISGKPVSINYQSGPDGRPLLLPGGTMTKRVADTEGQEWDNRLLGAKYKVLSDPRYIESQIVAPGRNNNLRYVQGLDTQSRTRERNTLLPYRVSRTRAETNYLNQRPGFENRRIGVAEGTLNLNKRRMFYQVPGLLGLEPAEGSTYTVDGETLQPFPAEGMTFVPRGTGAANRKAETVKGPPIGTEGVPAAIAKQLDSAGINPDVPGRYRQKSFQWWKKNAPGLLTTDLKGNVRLNMDSPDYERFQQDQAALDQQYAGMVEEAIRDFGDPANDGLTWEAVLKSDEYLSMSDADRRRVRQAFAASMKKRKKR